MRIDQNALHQVRDEIRTELPELPEPSCLDNGLGEIDYFGDLHPLADQLHDLAHRRGWIKTGDGSVQPLNNGIRLTLCSEMREQC